MVLATVAN